MKAITRNLRQLRRSIYNLLYYLPVIWNDRDWDNGYIEALQLKKFQKAYAFRTTSPYYMPSEGDKKENQALRICINILKRRCGSWYTNVWWEHTGQHDEVSWEPTENPDLSRMVYIDNHAKSPYYKPDYRAATSSVEERDWKILCDIIKKYQRRWWD